METSSPASTTDRLAELETKMDALIALMSESVADQKRSEPRCGGLLEHLVCKEGGPRGITVWFGTSAHARSGS